MASEWRRFCFLRKNLSRPTCGLLVRRSTGSWGSAMRPLPLRHASLSETHNAAADLSETDRILTWYYSGAGNGGIGHEQGPSHHPEKGPGSLGYYTRQQSRVRRRGWWGATQAGQETHLVAHRRGGHHSRLQGSSNPGRRDA